MNDSSQPVPKLPSDTLIGVPETSPDVPTWRDRRVLSTIALVCAMLAVAAALIFHVGPWLSEGLGDSHDGYNAAMWGLGARGAVEDPIGNRLGGVHPDGTPYANHPPLLVWSLTPVVAVADDWPLGLRLVPLAASLAAIALLALLMVDSGLPKWATAAGVLLGGTSGMYLTYGALVDTPVFGFPFALAAIWSAQRTWQCRPPRTWLAIALGCLAALAGWQALLAAVVAGTIAIAASVRSPSHSRSAAIGLLGGAGIGLLIDLSWTWWVLGGLSGFLNQGASRTEIPTSMWFDQQMEFALELFGGPLLIIAALGVLATIISLVPRLRHARRSMGAAVDGPTATTSLWESPAPLVMVLAIAVIGYAAIFKHAAWVHSYWNFYGVALVGMSSAVLVDSVARSVRSFTPVARTTVVGAMCGTVLVIACIGAGSRSIVDYGIQQGLDVVPLVDSIPRAADARDVVVATVGGDPAKPWLRWATHGQNRAIALADVHRLSDEDPVLITLPVAVDPSARNNTPALVSGRFALVPAWNLAEIAGG